MQISRTLQIRTRISGLGSGIDLRFKLYKFKLSHWWQDDCIMGRGTKIPDLAQGVWGLKMDINKLTHGLTLSRVSPLQKVNYSLDNTRNYSNPILVQGSWGYLGSWQTQHR